IHIGTDATFLINAAPGTYAMRVTLGDAQSEHDHVAVWAQGQPVASGISIVAGQFAQRTFQVTATTSPITLRFASTGGTVPQFAISDLEMIPVGNLPTASAGAAQ